MGLELPDTPVRLTWDLHGPGAPLEDSGMLAIAGRIAAGGVFFVTLEERPLAHSAVAGILRTLSGGGCQVQLSCAGSEKELIALETLLAPLPGVQLDVAAFLDLDDGVLDTRHMRQTLSRLREHGCEPALRLTPLASNLAMLPQLVRFCAENGAGHLKLPNARIGECFPANLPAELPRWSDLEAFREFWARQAPQLPELPRLEIHDRFLWEIMTPDGDRARSEYGGCQAANSLGHVDAAGRVYACSTWPEVLGSLCTASLDEIWRSSRRLALREQIATIPAGCLGCRDYASCLGGCRGLGVQFNHPGGCRDLMCHEGEVRR